MANTEKFLIFSEFGEILDLALHLQNNEKQEVCMYIDRPRYRRVGDGLIKKITDWYRCLGQGYIWVFDSSEFGDLQDWLRSRDEAVFGGSKAAEEMENIRQKNQQWFIDAGFKQPESRNFTDIDAALKFVAKNKEKRWILKQNGNAPKSLNHLGKFPHSEDMLFHLEQLKKRWTEYQYGKFDVDLMEIVEGIELAASAFFNGTNFLKNKQGKIAGYLNFEEKKEGNGNTGETTGEMGTTFIGVDETNSLFSEILLRPKIIETLRELRFRGVFDINAIKTKQGLVALEPTLRFGIPSTSYELMEGLASSTSRLLAAVANGIDEPIDIYPGVGMVMCIVAKPFPLDPDIVAIDSSSTSMGERIWLIKNDEAEQSLSKQQQQHLHLFNCEQVQDEDSGETYLRVATPDGFILTVTSKGDSIEEVREQLIKYIKNNIYLYGMKYRTDIGERVQKYIKLLL